eukprot:scaffold196736_cov30-Tisochrysis_lutea.AAC.2
MPALLHSQHGICAVCSCEHKMPAPTILKKVLNDSGLTLTPTTTTDKILLSIHRQRPYLPPPASIPSPPSFLCLRFPRGPAQ